MDRRVVKGGSRTGWIIGGLLIVVLAVAAYLYFVGGFSGYGNTGDTGETTQGDTEIVLPDGD